MSHHTACTVKIGAILCSVGVGVDVGGTYETNGYHGHNGMKIQTKKCKCFIFILKYSVSSTVHSDFLLNLNINLVYLQI